MRALPDKLAPRLLKVMVGYTDWAVKEYQTSAPAVPQLVATAGAETVALLKVPATGEQLLAEVSRIALLQRLLAGACALAPTPARHISNIVSIALQPERVRVRYVFIA